MKSDSQGDWCCLYWIHLGTHTDPETEGYIGISNDPHRRFQEHKRSSLFITDGCRYEILMVGGRDRCLEAEHRLRPHSYIGWNTTAGGYTEKLEHLARRSRQYYSKNYGLSMGVREWSHYLGINYEVLRKFVRSNDTKSIDYAIQKCARRSVYRTSHEECVEEAMYYLENTAMLPTPICKKVGWDRSLQDMFKYTHLPNNLLRNCRLPIYEGSVTMWMKRQQVIHDFYTLSEIYDMYEGGASVTEVVREIGYSFHVTKACMEDLSEMRHV